MIIALLEHCTPKEKSHPVFICTLGSLETVYTVVIFNLLMGHWSRAWTNWNVLQYFWIIRICPEFMNNSWKLFFGGMFCQNSALYFVSSVIYVVHAVFMKLVRFILVIIIHKINLLDIHSVLLSDNKKMNLTFNCLQWKVWQFLLWEKNWMVQM